MSDAMALAPIGAYLLAAGSKQFAMQPVSATDMQASELEIWHARWSHGGAGMQKGQPVEH